ncbi:MAG: sulfatase-like hydrolase/transferase [Planctomycetota bacterium]
MPALSRLFVLLCVSSAASHAAAADRPNVVLIISDDHAWTDYGFMGHPHVRTPAIDRLAADGRLFTRGYVTTSLCSPSLATLLTGRYPHIHGITGNDPVAGKDRNDWLGPFFDLPLLPRLLADAGYRTLHTGKFWMGEPARVGFTDDMGATDRHGGRALTIGRQTMAPIDTFVADAVARDEPFFVWYAPFLPHTPHNPPERLLANYTDVKNRRDAKYLAMVEWLDETCGQLLRTLDDARVASDTLVIYIADNGWGRDGKCFPYENGVRTPIILRGPGVEPSRDDAHLAGIIDVVPTILDACGVDRPAGLPGLNLLDDDAVGTRRHLFQAQFAHDMLSADDPAASLWSRGVVGERFKLIEWVPEPPAVRPSRDGWRHKNAGVDVELFDVLADPAESREVSADYPSEVAELRAALDAWWRP